MLLLGMLAIQLLALWQTFFSEVCTLALTSISTIFAVATMFTGDEGEELSGRALGEFR